MAVDVGVEKRTRMQRRPLWRHPKWTKAHRWITLIVGVQLLCWIVSGAVFVFNDIDNVHGDYEFERPIAAAVDPGLLGARARRAAAALTAASGGIGGVSKVVLTTRMGRPVFAVYQGNARTPLGFVDAETGTVVGPIQAAQAEGIAKAHYKGSAGVRSVRWLEAAPLEYRGGPLPVYRVDFDDSKHTSFFISPESGAVVMRRNRPWRIFDFFWMLHTMDYANRDDFNHRLIRTAAVLAALAGLSGAVLLFQRFLPLRRGRGPDSNRA